jgi:hypothetical protein
MTGERARYIGGLRAMAELLESTPDLPLPAAVLAQWHVWPHVADDVPAEVIRLVRLIGGRFDKNDPAKSDYNSIYYEMTGNVGGMPVTITTYRDEVCRKVVTGSIEVVKTVPAPDAPMVEVKETIETFEWQCVPLLAEATR